MGGTGHIILTALTGAASGNVTGSSAQFAQAAAINVLQSYTVQEVKQIADGFTDKAQSEAVRTALQALTACAGAGAKGGDCSQGAMGAASAVVIANLIDAMAGEKAIKEWADGQKDSKDEEDDPITKEGLFSNIVTNLIVGITEAAGGDSVVAGWAGKTEVENNYLGPDSQEKLEALRDKSSEQGGLSVADSKQLVMLDTLNQRSDEVLEKYRQDPNSLTPAERDILSQSIVSFIAENLKYYDRETVDNLVNSLFTDGVSFKDYSFPYAASGELREKMVGIEKEGMSFWDSMLYLRDISPAEEIYRDASGVIIGNNNNEQWAQIGGPALSFTPGNIGTLINGIYGGYSMGEGVGTMARDGYSNDALAKILFGALDASWALGGAWPSR